MRLMKLLGLPVATLSLAALIHGGAASAAELELKFGHVGAPGSLSRLR